MNNPLKSQIAANRERFEKKWPEKYFESMQTSYLRDIRFFRNDIKSDFTTSLTSAFQTAIAAVEGLKTEEREGLNLSSMDRSVCADKGYELALSKVVELLKGGIDN
jgi:hypothetical protein